MTYLHLVLFQRDRRERTFSSSLQRIKTYFITCMNLEGSGSGWYQMTHPPQSSLFGSTLQLQTACLHSNPTDLQLCKNTWLWLVQQASTHQRPNPANCMDHGCLWSITNIIIIQSKVQLQSTSSLTAREYSCILMQPAYEASSSHITVNKKSPILAKWLNYLLVNSCVRVDNTQIISAVCLKA